MYTKDELASLIGLILLMAMLQENKQKVQPVMDYSELNKCRRIHSQCRYMQSKVERVTPARVEFHFIGFVPGIPTDPY